MTSNTATKPKNAIAPLVALTVLAVVIYLLSAYYFNYRLMCRASEDAYASSMLRRAAAAAGQMQDNMKYLADDMESLGLAMLVDPDAEHAMLLENIRTKHSPLLLAIAVYDSQGHEVGPSDSRWETDAFQKKFSDYFVPDTINKNNITPRLLTNLSKKTDNQTSLAILIPVFRNSDHIGAVVAAVSTDALYHRFLAGLRDSDSTLCWLTETEQVLAGLAPGNAQRLPTQSDEREFILESPDPAKQSYAVMDTDSGYRLTVYAPATIFDCKLVVGLSILWNTVRLAPHALFKGSVILAAWAVPIIALLMLFSLRAILLAVTERERNTFKNELDDTQAKLLAVIESINEPVCLFQPEEPFAPVFASRSIENLTGRAAIEFIADEKAWLRLVHPDDRDELSKKRMLVARDQKTIAFTYRIKHRSEQWIVLQESLNAICDAAGKTTQLLSVLSSEPDLSATPSQINQPSQASETLSQEASPTRTSAVAAAKKSRVLLADDDRLLVSLFSKALERMGYGITGAYNGLQAVELFKTAPNDFDVIVLDMVMPKMSGLEAIKHLRKIRPAVKIIGISGYSTDGQEWDLPQHGVQAFLSKPFDIGELAKHIDALSAQEKQPHV